MCSYGYPLDSPHRYRLWSAVFLSVLLLAVTGLALISTVKYVTEVKLLIEGTVYGAEFSSVGLFEFVPINYVSKIIEPSLPVIHLAHPAVVDRYRRLTFGGLLTGKHGGIRESLRSSKFVLGEVYRKLLFQDPEGYSIADRKCRPMAGVDLEETRLQRNVRQYFYWQEKPFQSDPWSLSTDQRILGGISRTLSGVSRFFVAQYIKPVNTVYTIKTKRPKASRQSVILSIRSRFILQVISGCSGHG